MASKATAESEKSKRLTRKQRKDLGRRIWSEKRGLDVAHRDAAGIDIGSREHYVAVGPDRDAEPVRVIGCFTTDLHRMAEWLKQCGVKTVVMQSTGVYWIPVYDVLEQYGFEVWLVNAKETKNLPGRKSDVQESQWLLKLHTYGLLRKSLRPTPEIRGLRTCWRERSEYVQQAGACIQRMQKALTEMNVQVATVLSDLSGVTGMSILRSIVAGEGDGMRLAQFRDPPCEGQQGNDSQEFGRHVAAGTVGDIEAATGGLGSRATANGGLRCGFAGHAEGDAGSVGQADASVASSRRDPRQAKQEEEGQLVEERAEL